MAQQLSAPTGRGVEQRLDAVELVTAEVANLPRQPACEQREGGSAGQDGQKVLNIFQRVRRTDLTRQPTAYPVIRLHRLKHRTGVPDRQVLKGLGEELAGVRIASGKRTADIGAIILRFGRQEIAADPGPERSERRARDAALQFAGGIDIDEEGLDRPEEVACRSVTPRRVVAGLTQHAAQFLQHDLAAWDRTAPPAASSFLISSARDSGGSCWRYSCKRSTDSPLAAIPQP